MKLPVIILKATECLWFFWKPGGSASCNVCISCSVVAIEDYEKLVQSLMLLYTGGCSRNAVPSAATAVWSNGTQLPTKIANMAFARDLSPTDVYSIVWTVGHFVPFFQFGIVDQFMNKLPYPISFWTLWSHKCALNMAKDGEYHQRVRWIWPKMGIVRILVPWKSHPSCLQFTIELKLCSWQARDGNGLL